MLLMEILIQDLMKFLVVTGPTHLNGGLLDHVYLLKSFPRMNVNSFVKNVYFSDHDAVKLKILAKGND